MRLPLALMQPIASIPTWQSATRSATVFLLLLVAAVANGETTAVIDVSQGGQPIAERATVSGIVDVRVTVTDGMHQHVQVYGNMITLPFTEPGHAPDTPVWSRTVRMDTRRFFDGENLVSVHVHPHNVAGEPYRTDFLVSTFVIVTNNAKPAPNGDRLLPTVVVPASAWRTTYSDLHRAHFLDGDATLADDSGNHVVDRNSTSSRPAQIIPHLGEAVLGRFRWHDQTPPFGDREVLHQVMLTPFQRDTAFTARVVLFACDGAGRANYGFRYITVPAFAPDADRRPTPNARILGLAQGATLRVPADGQRYIQVELTNLDHPCAVRFEQLTCWVGNRMVSLTRLRDVLGRLPIGATSAIIDVPINGVEIQRLQWARQGGEANTAFPIWLDFSDQNQPCLPTSSHIHLNSIRTVAYPWPYEPPTIAILTPGGTSGSRAAGVWTGRELAVRYDAWGPLPSGTRARIALDDAPGIIDADFDGAFTITGVQRGDHTLRVTLVDAAGAALPHASATAQVAVRVGNALPVAHADHYVASDDRPLTVAAQTGLLANDGDIDGDALTAATATPPTHGTVTVAADGSFTYVPEPGFHGRVVFTYRASDAEASAPVPVVIRVGGADGAPAQDWPMTGGGPGHTGGVATRLTPIAPLLRWSRPMWSAAAPAATMQPVAVVGDLVYASTGYLNEIVRVRCLDGSTGAELWHAPLPRSLSLTGPAFADDQVFAQREDAEDSEVFALDAYTGRVDWRSSYRTQSGRHWPPTVAGGGVYVDAGMFGGIRGFAQDDGVERWFTDLEQNHAWTPTWWNGRLFSWVVGQFREHDPATGAITRTLTLPWSSTVHDLDTTAVVADGRAWLRSTAGLFAVDLASFTVAWSVAGTGYVGAPAVHGDELVALIADRVECRDARDGALRASITVGDTLFHQPIVTDDLIIAASYTQTFLIDRATRTVTATLPTGGYLALCEGDLYIAFNPTLFLRTPHLSKYRLRAPADRTPPTASLAFTPDPMTAGGAATVRITFSEPVTGNAQPITVAGGSLTSITRQSGFWDVDVQHSGSGTQLTVTLAAGAIVDAAGNASATDHSATVAVVAPPSPARLVLSGDNRIGEIFVDGRPVPLGPNASDWTRADEHVVDLRTVIAVKTTNDEPARDWAGFIVKATLADGSIVVSDATWKCWTGSGTPPNDGLGRQWHEIGYDDRAWIAATRFGAYGVAPWGTRTTLAGLDGAGWIWHGNARLGVSPVWFRKTLDEVPVPPPANARFEYTIDNRAAELWIDGIATPLGANNANWQRSDVVADLGDVRVVAMKTVNDEPGAGWAGLLGEILFDDGRAFPTDATWRAHVGPPPPDAAGKAWYQDGYDASAWIVPTVRGAYGIAPWNRHAGLVNLEGASWIWPGDITRGVSPVYLRFEVPRLPTSISAR